MVKGILVNRKSDETYKAQLKMEHADLVAEMQTVENLPTHERLQLARLRRTQQLKLARQKEKEWLKLQRAKGNSYSLSHNSTTHHFRTNGGGVNGRHISFENSVVLLEAASRNDMQEVAELLERGITPDAANEDGLTALHQCCIDNNVEMLKLLLEYGAKVDAQDSDKWTPLHAAATCGHLELVRILIDHGANLLAVNTDGNMPYDLCDDENTLDYIEAEMSKRGVTQELIDETRSSTERQMLNDLTEAVRVGRDLEEPDYQGATPLHIAAANGYVRVVEFLLELHVNVDAMDKDMWSPVHAAACWGHLEVLEMLAQCGADLNVKNKDDETPSDICEDPEIRERIEQLKTEQESKRLAEAQRRRVRRSQSNNTRAQSVRRTSLRDKTLTTKKDAVEEARLRLQAQEVFIAPDSTTLDPNGSSGSSGGGVGSMDGNNTYHSYNDVTTSNDTATTPASNELANGLSWLSSQASATTTAATTNGHNNNNNNAINNNDKKPYQASLAAYNGGASLMTHSMSVDAVDSTTNTATTNTLHSTTTAASYIARRPPDGRENDELQMCTYKAGDSSYGGEYATHQHQRGSSSSATAVFVADRNVISTTGNGSTLSAEALQIQTGKEAANGKINVQVTVLVDTTSTHHHQAHQQQQQQQLQLDAISSGNTGATNFGGNGATLANLKKQRSLSRYTVFNNCENGSVLGATNTTTTSAAHTNHNNNNNNSITSGDPAMLTTVSNQPTSTGLHPSLMDYNGIIMGSNAVSDNNAATGAATAASVNKFSGITGDVVSDSTSSKKCCTLM